MPQPCPGLGRGRDVERGFGFGFYTARDPLVAPAPPGPIRESSGFIARVRRPLVLDTCLLVAEEAPVPMGNELGDELRRLGTCERLEFPFALGAHLGEGAQRPLGLLRFSFGLCAPEP